MGKRSTFDRVEKDFYRTIDTRAVEILSPFLVSETKYAEPCCGQDDLINELEKYGHINKWASDISYGTDALTLTDNELSECDAIITNPPWSRDILHPMIEHFAQLKPTWLLFDADWAHTKQSSTYMKELCTDIVSVGRLRWIEGTTMSGKDNCAWYRFDKDKNKVTEFHGR